MKPQRRREITTLIVVFTGVLLISALAVYLIGNRGTNREYTQVQQPTPTDREPLPRPTATPTPAESGTFLDHLMGTHDGEVYVRGESWAQSFGRISLRLLLAALLGAALAYRPRRKILSLKQNPYVSQTQILLAIVAAALMIIVGDNAARAFGIFAAVSLVRFRTNIRDPKEVTVLLICMALGLAAGVGRWDLGLALALFSLVVLWILEWREPEQVFRSMELKVTTKNVVSTQRALREILKKHGFDKELRAVDREVSDESPGSIMYSVDVSPTVSTDELSADILALDGQNVEGIEWNQKKSYSYLYQ
ncbi:MAG: DUF4956 domain-containing protein [Acidobacteria bacterium]|nr:DUF4956 domain-containing protein [Acidobacteriota bacterium]MCA1627067.1 DUF4956 domain-containing protein [Acidobacteriota bacterium]